MTAIQALAKYFESRLAPAMTCFPQLSFATARPDRIATAQAAVRKNEASIWISVRLELKQEF